MAAKTKQAAKPADQTPAAPKKRPGVRSLKTPLDVKRLLARLIKANLAGTITDSNLRALTQACTVLLKSVEAADFAKELQAINEKIEQFEKRRFQP